MKLPGAFAPDGSLYISFTNGNNTMTQSGGSKIQKGLSAPDGSIYTCKTDGNGNLR